MTPSLDLEALRQRARDARQWSTDDAAIAYEFVPDLASSVLALADEVDALRRVEPTVRGIFDAALATAEDDEESLEFIHWLEGLRNAVLGSFAAADETGRQA